jgi:hypothetical protein
MHELPYANWWKQICVAFVNLQTVPTLNVFWKRGSIDAILPGIQEGKPTIARSAHATS